MHPLYQQWLHLSFDATLNETLDNAQKAWIKIQKYKTHNRALDRAKNKAIEDKGLRYPKLRYHDSIRILELLPATSKTSPIFCRLKSSRIEESWFKYEALSYVWGDVTDTVDLHCEGKAVPITRNLDAALRHLRYTDRSRFLWVDAVSINQADVAERGHQVRLMRAIYKEARRVLIWIGTDAEYIYNGYETTKAAYAFELFHVIFDHMNVKYADIKVGGVRFLNHGEDSWQRDLNRELAERRERKRQRPYYDETWNVVEEFFQSRWFSRQWIIQEVVVASSATVIWGHCEIEWSRVGEVSNWLKMHHPPSRRQYIPGAYNASYIYYLSMEAQRRQRLHPFLTVVASAWNFQSTDPRDRIFALLGMPNSDSDPDNGKLFMEPDYTLTLSQVYTAFARKVLVKERNLRIFSAVQHDPNTPLSTPSWVPQWQSAITEPLVPIGNVINRMPDYSLPDQSIFTFDSELLVLRGLTLGTISGHTDSILSTELSDSPGTKLATLITCVENILSSQSQVLNLARLKCLCWTLTVGRGNDFWANHINHWDVFQALWLEARKQFATKNWKNIGVYAGDEAIEQNIEEEFLGSATYGRRVLVTSEGMTGLGPAALQPGDIVVLLFGGFTPFVLRRVQDHYLLVGECYVHGQMDGVAVEEWLDEDGEAEVFNLR